MSNADQEATSAPMELEITNDDEAGRDKAILLSRVVSEANSHPIQYSNNNMSNADQGATSALMELETTNDDEAGKGKVILLSRGASEANSHHIQFSNNNMSNADLGATSAPMELEITNDDEAGKKKVIQQQKLNEGQQQQPQPEQHLEQHLEPASTVVSAAASPTIASPTPAVASIASAPQPEVATPMVPPQSSLVQQPSSPHKKSLFAPSPPPSTGGTSPPPPVRVHSSQSQAIKDANRVPILPNEFDVHFGKGASIRGKPGNVEHRRYLEVCVREGLKLRQALEDWKARQDARGGRFVECVNGTYYQVHNETRIKQKVQFCMGDIKKSVRQAKRAANSSTSGSPTEIKPQDSDVHLFGYGNLNREGNLVFREFLRQQASGDGERSSKEILNKWYESKDGKLRRLVEQVDGKWYVVTTESRILRKLRETLKSLEQRQEGGASSDNSSHSSTPSSFFDKDRSPTKGEGGQHELQEVEFLDKDSHKAQPVEKETAQRCIESWNPTKHSEYLRWIMGARKRLKAIQVELKQADSQSKANLLQLEKEKEQQQQQEKEETELSEEQRALNMENRKKRVLELEACTEQDTQRERRLLHKHAQLLKEHNKFFLPKHVLFSE